MNSSRYVAKALGPVVGARGRGRLCARRWRQGGGGGGGSGSPSNNPPGASTNGAGNVSPGGKAPAAVRTIRHDIGNDVRHGLGNDVGRIGHVRHVVRHVVDGQGHGQHEQRLDGLRLGGQRLVGMKKHSMKRSKAASAP